MSKLKRRAVRHLRVFNQTFFLSQLAKFSEDTLSSYTEVVSSQVYPLCFPSPTRSPLASCDPSTLLWTLSLHLLKIFLIPHISLSFEASSFFFSFTTTFLVPSHLSFKITRAQYSSSHFAHPSLQFRQDSRGHFVMICTFFRFCVAG